MQAMAQPAQPRRPVPRRIKFGIGLTVLSLVILVLPGTMELPLSALEPLQPRMGGCANLLIPLVGVAFFVIGFLLSAALIVFGIVAVILAGMGRGFGLVASILVNAVVATLLLLPSITFGPGPVDPQELGLFGLLAACAVVPVAAVALLLRPAEFRSHWPSRRPLAAICVIVALVLAPGAAGLVGFGLELGGFNVQHVQTTTPVTSRAPC